MTITALETVQTLLPARVILLASIPDNVVLGKSKNNWTKHEYKGIGYKRGGKPLGYVSFNKEGAFLDCKRSRMLKWENLTGDVAGFMVLVGNTPLTYQRTDYTFAQSSLKLGFRRQLAKVQWPLQIT